jgi:Tol biopolymer transport system component
LQPDWSPDGKTIAYTFAGGLFAVDARGASAPRLLSRVAAEEADWAPDGRTIVVDDATGIYTVGADGSHATRLLVGAPGSSPHHASWSPDGTQLLYAYTPGASGVFRAEVWRMDASGARKKRIYRSRCCVGEYYGPVWSPDGRRIAFASDSGGGTVLMNADGSARRPLLASTSPLSWSRTSR